MTDERQNTLPSFKRIAEKMQDALRTSNYDYQDEQEYAGVLTISYNKLHQISKRYLFTKRFYSEIELEASRLGMVVAFGQNAVIIAADIDFASGGWSSQDTSEPMPVSLVELSGDHKPLFDELQKRALFARIKKKNEGRSSLDMDD